jgi:hypothetical protein
VKCRHCATELLHTFLDLGFAPPSNAFLNVEGLTEPEIYYPLKIKVCDQCWLTQTEDYAKASELFDDDYAYFSGTSSGWVSHAAIYSEAMIDKLRLTKNSFVIEVASNDGYLLRNFVAAGIPCLGIEPTASTASAAEKLGIPVMREFFGEKLASELASSGKQADLIIGNNVYAHVPNINDFTCGLKAALKLGGTITLEFPHLMRLIEKNQFDTIYHEHFSYLLLCTVVRIFETAGLRVFDVEELSTHGGSLRVYGCHFKDARMTTESVAKLLEVETSRGLQDLAIYKNFQAKADKVKNELLYFLIQQKQSGKRVVAYGAAAKGNTLLNYAGIKPDLLQFICDQAVSKQGKFTPGSHIPILAPSALINEKIDYLLILPWNIADEVTLQNIALRQVGVKFVTAVPSLKVHD